MHVLVFSLDASMLNPDRQIFGATLGRQLEMAEALEGLHIIVRTFKGQEFKQIQASSNLWIYPTDSINKLTFLHDAYQRGSEICRQWPVAMIASQDPFYSALPAYALSRRLGIPLNVLIAGEMLNNPFWLREHPINRVRNIIGKWMLRRAATIRVSTNTEREQIISMGIPDERVWNVPFRVSFQRLAHPNGEPLREQFINKGLDRLILSVGRLSKEKDYLTGLLAMLRVVRKRPSTGWIIVGGGPEESTLRHQIRALGLADNVFLIGPKPYDSIPDYFGAADCFLLSSYREGTSMVLLEAAYFGLPVVSTDTTGARDAVRDGETGYLAPRGDARALAECILRILDDPSLAESMGERGKAFVQKAFDPELLLRRYLDLWYATAGRNAAKRLEAGTS